MFKTVKDITDTVYHELSLVSGTNVQIYTEPLILANINISFEFLFKKRFWPHLTKTTQHSLTGTSGVITDAQIDINDLRDIQWIAADPYYEEDKLRFLNGTEYQTHMPNSYDIKHFQDTDYSTKLIQFYPLDLALDVKIRARRKVDEFKADTDIVPFDYNCIIHLTASNILASDGYNPSAENRQNILFEQAYEDLLTNEAKITSYISSHRETNTFTVA